MPAATLAGRAQLCARSMRTGPSPMRLDRQLAQGAPEQQSSSVTGPRQPVDGGLRAMCPHRADDFNKATAAPAPVHEGKHSALRPCSSPKPAE